MAAIGRFGSRVVPELSRIMRDCRARKQIVEGPHIERFEQEFAIGLAGLEYPPEFIERTRHHAALLDDVLGNTRGITIPHVPSDRTHVYYQYCAYVSDSDTIVKRCIRRGVDVAPMHVDVCTTMALFDWSGPPAPDAEYASTAVQVPVYESLQDGEIARVGRLVRDQVLRLHARAPRILRTHVR